MANACSCNEKSNYDNVNGRQQAAAYVATLKNVSNTDLIKVNKNHNIR